ncbi:MULTISPECIES: DmsC/YnfH family molybdoenzyme membrane anchor subunit [unclassified Leclercia]|jgi:anaerobic dimethyl sulfoxide reductase subunit C (anchor subunit)|uniref:dimethyl sulfoxide reductase anchor subunit family protein n=1 Tax=unclassified Leclercia TaxID=2627398 RepID=UPI002896F0DA|nr:MULTISPECIES: DmsC/YnfH family molybdoenzyme membrane anchor subunit [unclassified Leclercia]MDY0920421.1 DmsC/YnfH family molybdoenzyme membrane anchor subunit [Leclercia sp. CFBP8987]
MHELPLLIFTLLVQGSVGMTLFLALSARAGSRVPEVKPQLLPGMLIACVAGGLGLVVSTLHLGYPLNAFNALRHVASSWLSREIVFASLYLAALGLCTLVMLVRKQLIPLLLPVAAVLGLIDVWCMSAIYAHTSVITWSHFNTWLMFYGAVGVLGAVALAWLPMLKARSVARERQSVMRFAAAMVVAIVAIRLLAQPDYIAYLANASLSGVVTLPHQPMAIFTQLSGLRLFSWTLSVLGALLFAVSAWRQGKLGLMVGSLLLVLSEVLFRFMFFCIN